MSTPKLRFKEFKGAWKSVSLGDVTKYTKGFAFKSEDFVSDGVRVIRVSDLGAEVVKSDNDKIYFNPKDPATFDRYFLKKNNIIVTTVGSKPDLIESAVGRAILVRNDDEGLLNQNLLKFENIDLVDNEFIYGILKRKKYHLHIKGIARGNANQSNITVVDLLDFKLSIPSLPEQQKIASFLSAVDEKIQQLTRKKELLEQYKKGVMQQLFSGKLRFKDENGNPYPKWEDKKIGDFTKVIAGGTPSTLKSEYWGGDIRWMNSGELNFKIVWEVENRITKKGLDNSSTKLIPPKCVLIGLAGQGKTRGTVAINMIELCTNQSIAAIFPNERIFITEFLYHNLDMRYDELRRLSTGEGGRGGLNLQIIKALVVSLPCLQEQQKIASFLSAIDAKIEGVANQITKAQTFKKGLLQQMFV